MRDAYDGFFYHVVGAMEFVDGMRGIFADLATYLKSRGGSALTADWR
jgi:hypothetical protein